MEMTLHAHRLQWLEFWSSELDFWTSDIFLKIAQAEFWTSFIFSVTKHLIPHGYCAPWTIEMGRYRWFLVALKQVCQFNGLSLAAAEILKPGLCGGKQLQLRGNFDRSCNLFGYCGQSCRNLLP